MPQIQLPVFPEGVTHITPELAFSNVKGQITYFNGSMPIFTHDANDTKTFRMITSQFCVNGATRLVEISKAFGVPAVSVKRAVKLYRKEGPSGFFKDRKARGKSVLTERVIKQAQDLLNQFIDPKELVKWNAELCKDWMEEYSDLERGFCIDGHVRVYHGSQTQLPRHYVAREKLCLRATTDYWVNAMDGQPFFLVNKAVDPGLVKTLESDIVPRLLTDVPNQPTDETLKLDKDLYRFMLIFDREGYSPKLFKSLWQKRIACLSYHKRPGDDWHADEFSEHDIRLNSGEVTTVRLAERGTYLSDTIWVREIRRDP